MLTLALVLAACGPAPIAEAPWPTAELAYVAWDEGSDARHVLITDAANREPIELTAAGPISDNVAWSPDGERVAYLIPIEPASHGASETYALRVVDEAADVELLRVSTGWSGPPPTPSAVALSWSAAGRYLALTLPGTAVRGHCSPAAGTELWRVDLEHASGPSVRRLADDVDAIAAAWSPDGDRLAYAEHHLVCGNEGELSSFGWSVRGWDFARDEPLEQPIDGVEPDVWSPAWSPSGATLAATVGDRTPQTIAGAIVVDTPDAAARVAFEAPDCIATLGGWFPDGARMLIRLSCGTQPATHVVVDAASGEVEAELPDLGTSVAIDHDGRRIAYVTNADTDPHVAVYDLLTGRSATIGRGAGPAWRPR